MFFHVISLDMVDHWLQMMKKRHKIERDLSIGEEVGWSKNQQVAKSNPNPCYNEQEVWDDPRAVITGQHHVVWQLGHALLVPGQQARAVKGSQDDTFLRLLVVNLIAMVVLVHVML